MILWFAWLALQQLLVPAILITVGLVSYDVLAHFRRR